MPASLADVFEVVTRRLRKLEAQEPGTKIYIQDTDPSILRPIPDGSLWIDTTTSLLYYMATTWQPVA